MMQTQISDGTNTRYAYQRMTISDDVLPGVEYIKELEKSSPFLRKLYERMTDCGYRGEQNDIKEAVRFLWRCCEQADVKISRQTLSNWLVTGVVAHNSIARENVYKLCFALKMNAHQTEEFFLKGYLDRPFNYKSLYETVCFFCLNNQGRYRYSDVARIIAAIEAAPLKENSTSPEFTVMIRSNVLACSTEEDLIKYWQQESASFGLSKYAAKSEVDALLKRCYEVAPKHLRSKINTPGALLEEIFDYRARRVEGGEKRYAFSIAKSSFPDSIKLNFPDPQKIWKILKDLKKNTNLSTDDMLRKAIIVLNFYAFFAENDRRIKNPRKYGQPSMRPLEEFTAQMNLCLERCGYVKLYWLNPFDWMFGYCAKQNYPLLALRAFIKAFYLDDCDNVDEYRLVEETR